MSESARNTDRGAGRLAGMMSRTHEAPGAGGQVAGARGSGRQGQGPRRRRVRESVGKRSDPAYKNYGFLLPVALHKEVKARVLNEEVGQWLTEQCEQEGISGTYGNYGLSELCELLLRDWLSQVGGVG